MQCWVSAELRITIMSLVIISLFPLENYNLSYTVLWHPNRFILLFVYAFWALFVLCGGIVYKMMTRCPFRVAKRQAIYSRVSSIPQF